ncbi:MAG: plastocyanin/azurin family copper-binding protein [Flavobacteriaceae bacterium]|nr:plastocyanin/azurin family copper-binding protein [Flavobacteriaceae bacterium]MDG1962684.1 plastocyanin/azurin family copper-binding protein [Flavobacteriaceae bacterium]
MKSWFILMLAAVTCFSCGETPQKKESLKIGGTSAKEVTQSNTTVLALSGNDAMQFDKKTLEATAGQPIKLTFRHVGKIEKRIMGHNFVLLKEGTNIVAFANQAAAAGAPTDWIPNEGAEVIAHTKMLGGGQSDMITFDAPEPGVYDFICSFPGHSSMMRGQLIVREAAQ